MSLVFALNGERVEIPSSQVDPSVTLSDYIHTTKFKGPKIGCGEGGCGACAVVLSRRDPATGKVSSFSVNSCLRPLASNNGYAVTTTEGLGNTAHGYHPIQERIAGFNGSQCGFCTPGMVMTIYSCLKQHRDAGTEPTELDLEEHFDGNLCRCTGYRPILDAAKSLAKASTVTDNVCKTTPVGPPDATKDPQFPSFLESFTPAPLACESATRTWHTAASMTQALDLLAANPGAKLVVGNTMVGIYKDIKASVYIDIAAVPELRACTTQGNSITVGAASSITGFIRELVQANSSGKTGTFDGVLRLVRRVANNHVRNAGSVGGNLCMAKSQGFLSDIATPLMAAGAAVTLASKAGTTSVSIEEFLREPAFAAGTMLQSITLPFSDPTTTVFRAEKTALRMVNCHAYVNAAFKATRDASGALSNLVVAFGGCARTAVRASTVEAAINGKAVSQDVCDAALKAVSADLSGTSAENIRLACSLLFKFLMQTAPTLAAPLQSAVAQVSRAKSSGHQTYAVTDEHTPVSVPISKLGSVLQASGEATFTGDVPLVAGTVFGSIVFADIARGKISSIDPAAALALPGVVRFISGNDIPGKNNLSPLPMLGSEPLYHTEELHTHGNPVGLIIANTQRHADEAAAAVKVNVTPIKGCFTIAEGRAQGRALPPQAGGLSKRGDVAAALASATRKVKGTVTSDQQKHFYMEPHSAYVVPAEDQQLTCYVQTQGPGLSHSVISQIVGLPQRKIGIVQKRIGGAFGAKALRNMPTAASAAVAAHILGRPVKVTSTRNADMRMTGGRMDVDTEYEVGFSEDGTITALEVSCYCNSGWRLEANTFICGALVNSLDQGYYIENIKVTAIPVLTDTPIRTFVRGPGEVESSIIIETVMDHVAMELGISSQAVRDKNLYPNDPAKLIAPDGKVLSHYTLANLWADLKVSSKMAEQEKQVAEFNAANRWRKRGLAMTPVRYHVQVGPSNAIVNVYADGSVLVSHGGVEMGQGIHTKCLQVAAMQLGKLVDCSLPMSLFGVNDTDSRILPNMGFTGGSTGSEMNADAVSEACIALVARMQVLKAKLEAMGGGGPITGVEGWHKIVAAATGFMSPLATDLCCEAPNRTKADAKIGYFNYGAAVSQVEIDVLTGDTTVVSVNLAYDCGKSLNPAIDIGQVEGAFMMGVGFYLREKTLLEDGVLVSDGTWEYKIPCYADVPLSFDVNLIQNGTFDKGFLTSKASGEPPLVLATSVHSALRGAIAAARRDAGLDPFVAIPAPCTPVDIQAACAVDPSQFKL